ncbi:helix-turn-helix domain-containing protein [Kitasatospora aureofaciens]|uniref:helix-turn-helix domain-containing protein n=1 Tax=Kitasatospora aureofaciens TaxID=1894 RepID=UPI001C48CA19|nr:helix-turn-helix domain-containing protein [Kitasatospora aureofaciens]MBV6699395.1 helix-turn-helix domain-containing protein [Kitasatospora aureofaciens]
MPPRPKPGSKQDRDAVRSALLATNAPTSAIAAEMRVRFGVRPREAWRHAHGWTTQEAADRFNHLAGDAGPSADASLLGKWEKWPGPSGRRITPRVLIVLADLYGASVDDLLDLDDRQALPEADLRILCHHADAASSASVAIIPASPATPSAEPAAPLTGAALVQAAAQESAQWAQWAEVTNCGPVALEQFSADTQYFAAAYLMAEDPLRVFQQTKHLLNRVWDLLYGHQRPQQRQELFTTAGYLFAMLSWMTSDLGHRAQAETHARAALLCADNADDPGLHAWACSTRSKLAFWDGQFRQAVQHAQHGATFQAPGTVAVLLHCQLADAWAEAGARTQALTALGQAEDAAALDSSSTLHDQVGGLFSCPTGRHANYGAAVHLRAGSASEALAHADRGLAALQQQRVRAYGTEAQLHITRAGAHLLARDPEGVLDAIAPVLALPNEHRTAPVRRRLRDLARDTAASPMGDSAAGLRLQDAVEIAVREAARALSPATPTSAWINDHD